MMYRLLTGLHMQELYNGGILAHIYAGAPWQLSA